MRPTIGANWPRRRRRRRIRENIYNRTRVVVARTRRGQNEETTKTSTSPDNNTPSARHPSMRIRGCRGPTTLPLRHEEGGGGGGGAKDDDGGTELTTSRGKNRPLSNMCPQHQDGATTRPLVFARGMVIRILIVTIAQRFFFHVTILSVQEIPEILYLERVWARAREFGLLFRKMDGATAVGAEGAFSNGERKREVCSAEVHVCASVLLSVYLLRRVRIARGSLRKAKMELYLLMFSFAPKTKRARANVFCSEMQIRCL